MASRKVRELLAAFRNHFQETPGGVVPLALRQESTDVVFTALYEEDAPVTPGPTPLLNEPAPVGSDPFADLAAQFAPAMSQMLGAQEAPAAPGVAPDAGAVGEPDLAALLGGLE